MKQPFFNINGFLKFSAITALVLILAALYFVVITPSANGYEMFIFDAYPWYFFYLLLIALLLGQLILLFRAVFPSNDKQWIFGLVIILLVNSILLLLPLIRGYKIYGSGDVLSGIGYLRDILATGHLGSNPYPTLFTISTNLLLFSGIDLTTIPSIIPFIFSFFFIASFYCLMTQVFKKQDIAILSLAFVGIPFFGIYGSLFLSYGASILLTPIFLYLFFRSRSPDKQSTFTGLTVIFLIFITFFHPLTALLFIGFMIIFEVSVFFWKKTSSHHTVAKIQVIRRNSLYLILIALFAYFSWQYYTLLIVTKAGLVVASLVGGGVQSELATNAQQLSFGAPSLIDTVKLIYLSYGQDIILLGIAAVCGIYVLLSLKSEKTTRLYCVFSSSALLFCLSVTVFSAALPQVVQFARFADVALIFAVMVLTPFLLWKFGANQNSNKTRRRTIAGLIVICFVLVTASYPSLYNLHISSRVGYSNQQVPASDIAGMQTFFQHRDIKSKTVDNALFTQFRYYDAVYGVDSNPFRNTSVYGALLTPDHFGYDVRNSFGVGYNSSKYLITTELQKEFYPYTYPGYEQKWRFTPGDFAKLDSDQSLQLIYVNNGMDIYYLQK